jgi:UPF0716 protein FxsA
MFALLSALFVVFSLVEIYVLVTVGQAIGALNTIALVILIAIIGAWLAKHEGASVLRRIQSSLNEGRMPSNELIDGGLILAGGILLVTPGFVTDIHGILCLFPPTRAIWRALLKRRFNVRVTAIGMPPGYPDGASPGYRPPHDGDDVIDV